MDEQNQYQEHQPTVIINQAPKNGGGMAIASLVIGIISFLFVCCGGCFSVVGGVVGLVFGIIVLTQKQNGKGMAIAGLILSGLSIILGIVTFVMYLAISAV